MGAELVHEGEYILEPYDGEIALDLTQEGEYGNFMGDGGGGGGSINLQTKSKTYTPTSSQQTDIVTADGGYDGLDIVNVTVNAIPSGTAGTPTATKGAVSNHSVNVTPSVTNTTGYITGSTKTGTPVSVSASELVSGTRSITTNGNNIDVVNYAAVNVNVSGGGPTLQAKTNIAPTTSSQTITPDVGYDGLSSVQINAMPSGTAGTPTATKGAVSNHAVSVTPSVTNTTGYITGSTKTGTAVSVSASELVSGTRSITANGSGIDVTNYAAVDVSVPQGGANLQSKSVGYTPTEGTIIDTLLPGTGYDGFSDVTVTIGAIPSNYIGSGVPQKSSSDLTVSGDTVTAPSGYYSSSASKSVASGTAGTPTATKGAVSNHSVSVTPSVTNTTGYITGSTKTGTSVTVSASELVSGSETKTANGTYDVTNLAELIVAVPDVPDNWTIVNKVEDDKVGSGLALYNAVDVAVTDIGAFIVYSKTSVSTLQNGDIVAILADSSGIRAWVYDNSAVSQLNSFQYIQIEHGQIAGSLILNLLTATYRWSDTTYNALFIYKSGGGSISFRTDTFQPGSGVTSAQYSVSENPPIYFCGLETEVTLASYHRVQTVVKHFDGDLMLCGTNFYTGNLGYLSSSSQLSESYANGTLTISTNNYNDGGYFHNPGTYTLYYLTEADLSSDTPSQNKTVTPNTTTQTVTADQGYVLGSVTVNPIPSSYVEPTSTVGATTYRASTSNQTIASGTYHSAAATIAAVSQTNLTAANIKNGTTITISNGQSNLWSVTGTYSGGGGASSIDTKTLTNSTNTATSLQFTSMNGQPIAFFLRCKTQIQSSGSTSYYYVDNMRYNGTNTQGTYTRIGSTRGIYPDTTHYSYSYSGTTLTVTSSGSRTGAGGSFYNGDYELVYIY